MEMTSTKTIVVFAIIFGCFAILYPKIFHPMLVYMLGGGSSNANTKDDIMNKLPPHLKKGPPAGGGNDADPHRTMRPGPHPGLHAAAELKRQAQQQGRDGGGGKGMMGVVLPMYAVGIVIYLVYTLSKVFGRSKEKEGPSQDYLSGNNPFKDIQYDADGKQFVHRYADEDDEEVLAKLTPGQRKQKDLEKLLLKADERSISENEMLLLKKRLLETENQMSRILQAMETMQNKVADIPLDEDDQQVPEDGADQDKYPVDLSPDVESYELINGKSNASSPSIEDLGPEAQEVFNEDYDTMTPENDVSPGSSPIDRKSSFDLDLGEEEEPFDEIDGDKKEFEEKAAYDKRKECNDEDFTESETTGASVTNIEDEICEKHPDLRKRSAVKQEAEED